VELEGSNVFAGRRIERFFDKVGELADVVGVGIDGGVGQMADHHVFGQPPSDRAGAFLVGRHVASRERKEGCGFPSTVVKKRESASPFYRNVRCNRTSREAQKKAPRQASKSTSVGKDAKLSKGKDAIASTSLVASK
jgi:hypothetical protein